MAAAANSPEKKDEFYKVNESTIPNFYRCAKKLASKKCQLEFAENNKFAIISTPKRGDCMYYALTYFGRLCKVPQLNKPNMILREEMVDKLLKTNYTSLGLTIEDIEELREKGMYDCLAGELPPAFIAHVFGVNVHIYRYDDATKSVTLNKYNVEANELHTIHLLHSHSHYRLLLSEHQIETYNLRKELDKYRVAGIISHPRKTMRKKPQNQSNMESNNNVNNVKSKSKTKKKKSAASASSTSNSNSSSKSSSRSSSKSPNNTVVYVNSTGKVYHLFENDAGKIYQSISKNDAVKLGKTLCKKCEKRKQSTRKSNNNSNNSNNELQQALAESLGKLKM
jgi:hypothetical protein